MEQKDLTIRRMDYLERDGTILSDKVLNTQKRKSKRPAHSFYLTYGMNCIADGITISPLLQYLCVYMSLDSRVVITDALKYDFLKKQNMSIQTFRVLLARFVKKNLMIRESTDTYFINPRYFFKGDKKRIEDFRKEYNELFIKLATQNPKKKKIIANDKNIPYNVHKIKAN